MKRIWEPNDNCISERILSERYTQAKEQGRVFFHKKYCLFHHRNVTAFDAGAVRLIAMDSAGEGEGSSVTVLFSDESIAQWTTKWLSPYIFQFGVAASFDGKYLFAQTWESGLICLDSKTGERVWKTKSRRGITNVFVNERTILCHQRERALQLIDMQTGEVLKEKRPATAWGFTAIDHDHIVCQVTAKRWEVIDAETLETKVTYSHRDFTGGHIDYIVNHIRLDGGVLSTRGFKNVWDDASPKLLPNMEFEHQLNMETDIK